MVDPVNTAVRKPGELDGHASTGGIDACVNPISKFKIIDESLCELIGKR